MSRGKQTIHDIFVPHEWQVSAQGKVVRRKHLLISNCAISPLLVRSDPRRNLTCSMHLLLDQAVDGIIIVLEQSSAHCCREITESRPNTGINCTLSDARLGLGLSHRSV